ncbi:S24 family peptidase [Sphingomonas sp. CARO-RG-8B-R24-01]|uniref:S24 family peptidase n=1 Tax=Sphingomonas sp. CARO-RG-8B-R24-01 TaxID=2914831 RepID=UPI001F5902C4|nr:S24 family peptidase [Sphingomonas sp. CARO-RG-8B-R24-01]
MTDQSTIQILRTRLAKAIEFRNVTPKALARTAGLGETVVRDILQGMTGDVKLGTVEKLARALNLSVGDLVPDALGTAQRADQPSVVSASRDDGAIAIRSVDIGYAMGTGRELEDYPDELPVLFDPGFLRTLTRASAEHLYLARGDGDSMFPTMINGDQVIIDTTQRQLNAQDRIWALSLHGAGMIKRLRTIGPNRVRIISDNEIVPPEDVDASDIHIAGRVIYIGRKT